MASSFLANYGSGVCSREILPVRTGFAFATNGTHDHRGGSVPLGFGRDRYKVFDPVYYRFDMQFAFHICLGDASAEGHKHHTVDAGALLSIELFQIKPFSNDRGEQVALGQANADTVIAVQKPASMAPILVFSAKYICIYSDKYSADPKQYMDKEGRVIDTGSEHPSFGLPTTKYATCFPHGLQLSDQFGPDELATFVDSVMEFVGDVSKYFG